MKKAQDDKNVKAVIVTVSDLSLGWAQIEELRQAIADLRAAGKDVYAHADSLSMPQYVLLAGATQLSVVPDGRPVDHRPARAKACTSAAARQARRASPTS